MGSTIKRCGENVTSVSALVVLGYVLLALAFEGLLYAAGSAVFGFAVIVPLVAVVLAGDDERRRLKRWAGRVDAGLDRHESEDSDPIEVLRRRYARGEVSDEQLDRALGRLLETEAVGETRKSDRIREYE